MKIDVGTKTVHETRYSTTLGEEQLHAIITEAVAKAAGIDLANARIDKCYITTHDTGTNISKRAEVVLVVNHVPQVRATDPLEILP